MSAAKFWMAFFYRDGQIDRWALCLDSKNDQDCDIWQASGQAFEFESTRIRGVRPESMPQFKDKWLIKNELTDDEVVAIRNVAKNNPVDNEGAYWDSRVFCFEIMNGLERVDVLRRTDKKYRGFRRRLHIKWKQDDGVSADTTSSEDEEVFSDEEPALIKSETFDLKDEPKANISLSKGEIDVGSSLPANRKRALSNSPSARFRSRRIKEDEDDTAPVVKTKNFKRHPDQ